MKSETYNHCVIRSTPQKIKSEGNYVVNGIIIIDSRQDILIVMTQRLNIPDQEYTHDNEDDANSVFIKYAKEFIDKNVIPI